MIPPYTCRGLCHPLCKNNCPLNKHIWVRDYRTPAHELELIIDIHKLKQGDVDFLRSCAPNVYHDLRIQYKKEKEIKRELSKQVMGEGLVDMKQVAPRRLPKPGENL